MGPDEWRCRHHPGRRPPGRRRGRDAGGRSLDAGGDPVGAVRGEEPLDRPIGEALVERDALGQVGEQQWTQQVGHRFGDVDVGAQQALVARPLDERSDDLVLLALDALGEIVDLAMPERATMASIVTALGPLSTRRSVAARMTTARLRETLGSTPSDATRDGVSPREMAGSEFAGRRGVRPPRRFARPTRWPRTCSRSISSGTGRRGSLIGVRDDETWAGFIQFIGRAPAAQHPGVLFEASGLTLSGAESPRTSAAAQMRRVMDMSRERHDWAGPMFDRIYTSDAPQFRSEPNAFLGACAPDGSRVGRSTLPWARAATPSIWLVGWQVTGFDVSVAGLAAAEQAAAARARVSRPCCVRATSSTTARRSWDLIVGELRRRSDHRTGLRRHRHRRVAYPVGCSSSRASPSTTHALVGLSTSIPRRSRGLRRPAHRSPTRSRRRCRLDAQPETWSASPPSAPPRDARHILLR